MVNTKKINPTLIFLLFITVVAGSLKKAHSLPEPVSNQGEARATTWQKIAQEAVEFYAPEQELRELIHQALERNPQLKKLEADWRAALETIPQVKALPYPMLDIGYERDELMAFGVPMVALVQEIPWFEKLSLEGKMALQEALAALYQLKSQQRQLILDVKNSYYEAKYLQEALEIIYRDRQLLEHFLQLAETRYATGQGLQQDVIKIQSEISMDDNRILELRQQLESAYFMLNRLRFKAPEETVVLTTGVLTPPPIELNLPELYAQAELHNTELKEIRQMIERWKISIKRAKKEYLPDFRFEAGYSRTSTMEGMEMRDRGDSYRVGVGLTLPIWFRKIRAGINQAQLKKEANEESFQTTLIELKSSLADNAKKLERTIGQLGLYENVLIPQVEETLKSAQAAYITGRLEALDLLDAERNLLSARLMYAEFKANYYIALANIEKILSLPFPEK